MLYQFQMIANQKHIIRAIHNYQFYADTLSLGSSRSGTKFTTINPSFIKYQRASTVCFRIGNYESLNPHIGTAIIWYVFL